MCGRVRHPRKTSEVVDKDLRVPDREAARGILQNEALVLLAAGLLGEKGGASCMLEDLADSLVGLCGTLEVLVGADLLADLLTLFIVLVLIWKQVAAL